MGGLYLVEDERVGRLYLVADIRVGDDDECDYFASGCMCALWVNAIFSNTLHWLPLWNWVKILYFLGLFPKMGGGSMK